MTRSSKTKRGCSESVRLRDIIGETRNVRCISGSHVYCGWHCWNHFMCITAVASLPGSIRFPNRTLQLGSVAVSHRGSHSNTWSLAVSPGVGKIPKEAERDNSLPTWSRTFVRPVLDRFTNRSTHCAEACPYMGIVHFILEPRAQRVQGGYGARTIGKCLIVPSIFPKLVGSLVPHSCAELYEQDEHRRHPDEYDPIFCRGLKLVPRFRNLRSRTLWRAAQGVTNSFRLWFHDGRQKRLSFTAVA
jgi:hypothetical protein